MNKRNIALFISAHLYAALGVGFGCYPFDIQTLKSIYICELIITAIAIIFIGLEDNKTLKVSWRNTALYFYLIIPPIASGMHSGALVEQLIYYLPGLAFAAVMIIYSFKTGRGGADRDIGILSLIPFPMITVLSLIPSLLISIIATAKRKQKYPFLFPFSIVFGVLAVTQLAMMIGQVMI